MDTLTISRCSISALEDAPNIGDLMAEYSRESAIDCLGDAKADWSLYHVMEDAGMLHCLSAVAGGALIGFILLLVAPNAHFSVKLAVTESIFVASAHRGTGAGLRLLREAETVAVELGAVGLLVSSPNEGRLVDILPRIGYDETNRVFFRSLS